MENGGRVGTLAPLLAALENVNLTARSLRILVRAARVCAKGGGDQGMGIFQGL